MFRKNSRRRGFTLVEMLVVIVIIGILMGLLLVAVVPALFTTYNFAVSSEISELSKGIDSFKTHFGFLPPSEFDFDADGTSDLGTDAEDLVTFKQYLRRIAPNHEQTDADITTWWTDIGSQLDNDSILVFWLSALKRNAQFPLTNGNAGAAWDGFANGDDPANYVFFEFTGNQLIDGNSPRVKRYLQRKIGDQPYLYYDWQRYPIATITIGGTPLYPYRTYPVSGTSTYYAPTTFQIVAAGNDRIFGAVTGPNNDWSVAPQFMNHRDNLTNFSGGILEREVQ